MADLEGLGFGLVPKARVHKSDTIRTRILYITYDSNATQYSWFFLTTLAIPIILGG